MQLKGKNIGLIMGLGASGSSSLNISAYYKTSFSTWKIKKVVITPIPDFKKKKGVC